MEPESMDDLANRLAALSPAKRALLEQRLKKKNTAPTAQQTILPRAERSPVPLSFAQQRLWFLEQIEPNSPLYNIVRAVQLSGSLNVEALQQSLNAIVERHESLRTVFLSVEGTPAVAIAPPQSVNLPVIDLSAIAPEKQQTEIDRLLRAEAQRPFNLTSDLMLRSTLLRLAPEEHVAILVMHHIATDGWSMDILLQELAAFYQAFSTGKSASMPELPVQYADFALWQRQWLSGDVLYQVG